LKLDYDELLSNVAFNFKLRRYIVVLGTNVFRWRRAGGGRAALVEHTKCWVFEVLALGRVVQDEPS
jgi:hypothetical protein